MEEGQGLGLLGGVAGYDESSPCVVRFGCRRACYRLAEEMTTVGDAACGALVEDTAERIQVVADEWSNQ